MSHQSLLTTRRFAPLFWTQFLGAFNDNFFKNALVMLIAFHLTQNATESGSLIAICQGLFILPFFLFSATAGQLADTLEKARLIQWTKLWEIGIMVLAAVGLLTHQTTLLMALLFLLGMQATFFGPLKYGILPQHLAADELVRGNAYINTGTFLAILFGTIGGGVLIGWPHWGEWVVALIGIAVAVAGWAASHAIPRAAPSETVLAIDWNIWRQTVQLLADVRENRTVFWSVLGISWFWFFGSALLTLFPNFSKVVLGGDATVVTTFLVMFCVGIGVGAALCNRWSSDRVELGLVPLGSIGMTLATVDLFFATRGRTAPGAVLMSVTQFVVQPGSLRILLDLLAISICGGLFIVPLEALIQQRAVPTHRARVIAACNVQNALFMVLSAGLIFLGTHAHIAIPTMFLMLAVLTALVSWWIYQLIPEFLLRFVSWLLVHTVYRLRVIGEHHIPERGAVMLVCNHVTFVDGLIVAAACRRPVRFVMDHRMARLPIIRYFCRKGRVIPIAGRKDNPAVLDAALTRIESELAAGEVVCIFPEGALTRTGEMARFRPGIEHMIAHTPVPVVPMALQGMWRSLFCRYPGRRWWQLFPNRWRAKITLVIDAAWAPSHVTAAALETQVQNLRGAAQ